MYSCAPWPKAVKPLPSPKIWTKYIYPPKKGHNAPDPTKYDPQTLDPPYNFQKNVLTLPKILWFLESMKRPWPPKSFGCFWHLPLVLCLFLKCSMYHEELPDPKKVCKLNRLQHEVLHIYVRVYSAYKNEYCEYILSQFTHFLPSEVMSIQFLLFSYSPLQWLFNSQYLYKRLSQLLQ